MGERGGDMGVRWWVSMLRADLGLVRAPSADGPEITLRWDGKSRGPSLPLFATTIRSASSLFPKPEPWDPR